MMILYGMLKPKVNSSERLHLWLKFEFFSRKAPRLYNNFNYSPCPAYVDKSGQRALLKE